jgi:hypothetical protein
VGPENSSEKRNSGYLTPGQRITQCEDDIGRLDKEGCQRLPVIIQEVKSVKTLGYALLGMQTIVLIGVLSLFLK